MITVSKQLYTETAHRLVRYEGRCAHLHGHSWLWEVEVSVASYNELDSRGMVIDFSDLKKMMMEVLDPWDHALILCSDDPLVRVSKPENFSQLMTATNGDRARVFIYDFNPTSENLASYAHEKLQRLLQVRWPSVELRRVSCKETANSQCCVV